MNHHAQVRWISFQINVNKISSKEFRHRPEWFWHGSNTIWKHHGLRYPCMPVVNANILSYSILRIVNRFHAYRSVYIQTNLTTPLLTLSLLNGFSVGKIYTSWQMNTRFICNTSCSNFDNDKYSFGSSFTCHRSHGVATSTRCPAFNRLGRWCARSLFKSVSNTQLN